MFTYRFLMFVCLNACNKGTLKYKYKIVPKILQKNKKNYLSCNIQT